MAIVGFGFLNIKLKSRIWGLKGLRGSRMEGLKWIARMDCAEQNTGG
jgi:hypothetical protein